MSIVKIHSHPGGYAAFSDTDDEGDARLLPMIRGWIEADITHGSAIMLPDGRIFGRILRGSGILEAIAAVNVAGDDLLFWYADGGSFKVPDFAASHAQAFDEGTIEWLQRLSIAVIGASGTGSPTIEQLMRLGAGELIIVDDDYVETRNINRILNATMRDAGAARSKVDVLAEAIERAGLGTKVIRLKKNLWDPETIRAVAQCDIVFGCMDTIDGRFLLNTLATYYSLPYFDVGVQIRGGWQGPDPRDLRVSTLSAARSLEPHEPGAFQHDPGRRGRPPAKRSGSARAAGRGGYIAGVEARRPAVISVNMFAAAWR